MNESPRKKLTPRNGNFFNQEKMRKKSTFDSKSFDQNSLEDCGVSKSEKPKIEYWKGKAEKQRVSLVQNLKKNEVLSGMLQSKNEEYENLAEENEILVAENSILSEKAEKASELEELLTSILSENSEDGSNSSKNESLSNSP